MNTQTKERKPTRAELRAKQRTEEEAKTIYVNTCRKFLDYFTTSDSPTGPETQEKINSIHAQWKVYCNRVRLLPSAYDMFKDYAQGLIDEYNKSKNEATEVQ